MEAELGPWWKLHALASRPQGDWTVRQAQIGRATVDFFVTGMGYENARRAAEGAMLNRYTHCVISGFCGAVRPGYAVGDIVVADAVQRYGKSKMLECSKGLTATAAEMDGAKRANVMMTVDEVVGTVEENAKIASAAAAVDMESFAVMEVAQARRVPTVAIRAVTDAFDQTVPRHVDEMIDEKGRVNWLAAARTLTRHPSLIPALVGLGRRSDTAAQALARFLDEFLKKVSNLAGEMPEELAKVAAQ